MLDAAGRCEEAEPYYRAALAEGQPSAALLNNAGNHYLVCGNASRAQTYFEKLLELNPAHTNANLQLARIAAERKQGKKALAHLERIRDSDPSILLLRAEALHWAGDLPASSKALEESANAARGDARLLFLHGITCARLGLYDRAEASFNSWRRGRATSRSCSTWAAPPPGRTTTTGPSALSMRPSRCVRKT
jgi:Flp pilus assembly protein TadD